MITSQLKLADDPADDVKFFGLAVNLRVAKARVERYVRERDWLLNAKAKRWRKRDNKHTFTVEFNNSATRQYFYCREEEVAQ